MRGLLKYALIFHTLRITYYAFKEFKDFCKNKKFLFQPFFSLHKGNQVATSGHSLSYLATRFAGVVCQGYIT